MLVCYMLVSMKYGIEDTILLDSDGKINKLFRPIIFLVRKLILNVVVIS